VFRYFKFYGYFFNLRSDFCQIALSYGKSFCIQIRNVTFRHTKAVILSEVIVRTLRSWYQVAYNPSFGMMRPYRIIHIEAM